jgi:tetratricopeptide (TPR) repeat protein
LKPEDARAFRLLGLHPSVEMGVGAAAALLGIEVPAAQRQLNSLVRWHLLEQVARGRYRFHDLLRIYAAECAERDDTETATRRSVELMLDWYLRSAVSAKAVLAPAYQQQVAIEPVDPQRSAMTFGTYQDALTWVRQELTTLIDALMLANNHGLDRITAPLAVTMGTLCGSIDRWMDLLRVDEIGLAAARRIGDRVSEVRLLHSHGIAYLQLDRDDEAFPYWEAVIDLITALGDHPDKSMLANLAIAYAVVGQSKVSEPMLEKALQIARETQNRALEASITGYFGELLLKLGRPAEAVEHVRRCVDLIREVDSNYILGQVLTTFGELCLRADHAEQAIGPLGEALQLTRTLGNPWGEVRALHALAEALHRTGKTDGVRQLLTDALAIMQETGYLAVCKSKAARIRELLTEIS